MKWLKGILAVAVIVASATAAWRLIIPRYECNRQKAIVNAALKLGRKGQTIDAARLAAACRRCLQSFPEDYELHTLLATLLEFLGDLDGAEASYRQSLRLNQRPETYAYLGLLELRRGRVAEARAHLYYGSLFSLFVAEAVSDPLRTELMEAVMARHRRLMKSGSVDLELLQTRRRHARRRAAEQQ